MGQCDGFVVPHLFLTPRASLAIQRIRQCQRTLLLYGVRIPLRPLLGAGPAEQGPLFHWEWNVHIVATATSRLRPHLTPSLFPAECLRPGHCHRLALEFARRYAGDDRSSWRWCMGRVALGTHSWIEWHGEAFDVTIDKRSHQPVVWVRPSYLLRAQCCVKNVESHDFDEVRRWLRDPSAGPLFRV